MTEIGAKNSQNLIDDTDVLALLDNTQDATEPPMSSDEMTDAPPYAEFGNVIAIARENAGLSRAELGELVGVSRQAVQRWEKGFSKPSARPYVELTQKIGLTELPPRSVTNAQGRKRAKREGEKNVL